MRRTWVPTPVSYTHLRSHAPERIVDAVWGESYSAGYSLVVRVVANDRSGLLRDITTILANEKVNVLGVASRSDTKQQLATIDMTIEIYNLQVLGRVPVSYTHLDVYKRQVSEARAWRA